MVKFRDDSWLSVQKKFLPGGTIWDACDLTYARQIPYCFCFLSGTKLISLI